MTESKKLFQKTQKRDPHVAQKTKRAPQDDKLQIAALPLAMTAI